MRFAPKHMKGYALKSLKSQILTIQAALLKHRMMTITLKETIIAD